jgi:hypothetical protein
MIYAYEEEKMYYFNKFVRVKYRSLRILNLRIEDIEMTFSYRVPYIKDRKDLIDFIFKQMEKPRLNLISVEDFLFKLKRNMNLRSIQRNQPNSYSESILYRIRTFSIYNINKTKYFNIRLKKSDTFYGFSVRFSEIYEEDVNLVETLIEGLQFK